MNREEIIRMAREAGLEVHPRKEQVRVGMDALLGIDSTEKVERFFQAAYAAGAAAEREALIALLKGIDQTENEAPDGWWETSTGADFGERILAAIRARGQA